MTSSILTVSQVNFFLKSLIEGDGRLSDVLVTGEISNFTDHYRSGHLYFSLKDEKSVLKAVMFSSAARRLRFRPGDGMKVIIRGRVSVYEPTGQYQLYAEDMQPDGVGALSLAYEQLKEKLAREGLFDQDRKRPIPRYPAAIGVVTSPTGAAVRDILQITARRWPAAQIFLCPVLVQGEGAPAQLIRAVRELNRKNACDVIILGRGGGSLEDLWAFNDEGLARTVAASQIPVVSAVGHETDFTICDFAADLRAPTPSAAAELCTPDREELLPRFLSLNRYFRKQAADTVAALRQAVDILVEDSPLGQADGFLSGHWQRLAHLDENLKNAMARQVEDGRGKLSLYAEKLDALSPLKVLSRGYAVVLDEKGRAVRDAGELAPGEVVTLRVNRGQATAKVLERSGSDGGEKTEL